MITGRLVEVNNKYYAILNLKHSDGKRLQKRFDLELPVQNNKRRAQEKLNALCEEYTRKQEVEQNYPYARLLDFSFAWLERRKPELSPSTYRDYLNKLQHHIRAFFDDRQLRQITFRDIEAYYSYLKEQGLSPTTIHHHHMLLQSIFYEALRQEIVEKNPMELVKKPKRNQPKVDFYSSQETQELLKAVKRTKLEIVVTLTVAYGLRRSEVLGLRWQDVDFDMGRIAVCHTVVEGVEDGKRVICKKDTMKEEASYRTLPLFEPITEMLRDELKRKHPYNPIYVCSDRYGRMMKPDVLTHDFKLFLEKSGLRHIRYHDLRHTTASLLIAEHVPLIEVQHWLGHKTMLTTANLYSHLDTTLIDECGSAVKKLLSLDEP